MSQRRLRFVSTGFTDWRSGRRPRASWSALALITVSKSMDAAERLHFETTSEWHDWLVANHRQQHGIWLVSWKPKTAKPAIPYEEAVEEALCHGSIDSTSRGLDDERSMQCYSPRRKGSLWAASNKKRVLRLEAQGRMTDAGRAPIEAAKADGSWSLLEPVEALIVPDDLAAAFAKQPRAMDHWAAFTSTAKRSCLLWIATAKRPQTRAKRVAESAQRIEQGMRFEER